MSTPAIQAGAAAAFREARAAAESLTDPVFISLADAPVPGRASGAATAGEPAGGPLDGLVFAVKDNIDVAGLPTTAGCPVLTTPAAAHAVAVQRLVRAGAVPLGKTNLDQFATGLVGTRSPYGACSSVASPLHVSGGSSSGSAVAVARGVVPFALGTDTAGSGRVPAAFNAIVGVKPTRGLVSTRGVLPACPSLDCISVFAGSVGLARDVAGALIGFDPEDPYSRELPATPPAGVARTMGVVGIPAGPLDLDPVHRIAWEAAVCHIGGMVRLVEVDVEAMLAAARMLYESPFVAERLASFGSLLEPDGDHLDPVVRRIVLGARGLSAEALFEAHHRLAELRRASERATAGVDAVLLPTTPGHPRLAEVAADPIGVNTRLGTYTNMANLLDLCAVALPAGHRPDGLPFGVQLLAPAFADRPLLDLAARLAGEPAPAEPGPPPGRMLLAVCGAHLSGEPLNGMLTRGAARLHRRARTAAGYRLVRLESDLPRPGLLDLGTGPAHGIEVEVWEVPREVVDELADTARPPLRIGWVRLDDGSIVAGFTADPRSAVGAVDISDSGGWRAHLAASAHALA